MKYLSKEDEQWISEDLSNALPSEPTDKLNKGIISWVDADVLKHGKEIEAGKEAGHTPVPWHVGCHGGEKIQIITVDANEEPNGLIAEINGLISIKAGEDIGDEAKANARFICKAVNCHDGLVEACRSAQAITDKLIEALKECITEDGAVAWRNHPFAGQRLEAISNIARNALKKAGEA